MNQQDIPKVGEVWGAPGKTTTWRCVVEILPATITYYSFTWGGLVYLSEWHAWAAEVKAERIFPPTQVTTGPWPQQT